MQQLMDELREKREWIGVDWFDENKKAGEAKEVRLLDYACGTGLVSKVYLSSLILTLNSRENRAPANIEDANKYSQQNTRRWLPT